MNSKFEQHKSDAKIKFNDKYDYSTFEYKGRKDKSVISCPLHGEFSATIYEHTKSMYGCSKCAKLLNPTYFNSAFFIKNLPVDLTDKFDFDCFEVESIDNVSLIIDRKSGEHYHASAKNIVLNGGVCDECLLNETSTGQVAPFKEGLKRMDIFDSYIEIKVGNEIYKLDITPVVSVFRWSIEYAESLVRKFRNTVLNKN